ncbi:histidine--tRNA ligase [Enterobacteriaceae endosymbiont of Donacia cincticornis]|uniref:histidine--tRNA ligase n=1 Tax=Enterobacteriaceae endosymbiont of Donacia cincticornis TaxID=2675773 RepID=UPI001448B5A4|nr:histidine--tRNA ligase [Enterobacteriaceae endosymbiont of Donacia cincticornis]QJC35946.1 histidine--tRNA ligase [Enterobacteriaceae endosymbiont of Donacia cincticornis]
MIKLITAVHGMHDYLFPNTILWKNIEKIIQDILNNYGYQEIKLPILEKSELFKKTIGEHTDVIEKEMYTLSDKNNNSLTLRPEGTAGFIRAIVEHNIYYNNRRFWYNGPMFRYERPQKGRYRQFHQIGIEIVGLTSPYIDAEVVIITNNIWKKLNITNNIFLEINSIGSLIDRKKYIKQLILFWEKNYFSLDLNDRKKIYTNPLRILDNYKYKNIKLLNYAPKLQNFLNKESMNKFNKFCDILNFMNIKFTINNYLVRGLDYYNDIVFEWKSYDIGSKNISKTICGGGRYDKLINYMSNGKNKSGFGCAIGIERLLLLVQINKSLKLNMDYLIDIFLIPMDSNNSLKKILIIGELIRKQFPKLRIIISYLFQKIKKQIIQANKYKSRFILIIGPKEIKNNLIILKDLCFRKQIIMSENQLICNLKKYFIM